MIEFETLFKGTVMILKAVPVTMSLVFLSLFTGFIFAVFLSWMGESKIFWVRAISKIYVFYFRGTPLLVQMYLLYFGVGFWITGTNLLQLPIIGHILSEPYWYAVLALMFNTAGYTAEILRGAIKAIDKGQVEAGYAIGMSRFVVFSRVTFPQALRYALPSYSNEVILMIKGSSLASTITVMEITGVMVRLRAETYAVYEFVILAGIIYLLLNYIASLFLKNFRKKTFFLKN